MHGIERSDTKKPITSQSLGGVRRCRIESYRDVASALVKIEGTGIVFPPRHLVIILSLLLPCYMTDNN
jgi:hypothetical protein